MVKKGDTLVEVTIAIGIFSLIAIAVASVMNSGSSGAQLSLETTLAREEIDTQADALRFVQSSYIANKESSESPLPTLWRTIAKNAISLTGKNKNQLKEILQYAPTSCSDFYDKKDSLVYQNAFILNPRALKEKNSAAYISTKNNSDKFVPASTYPRLIFGTNASNSDNGNLSDNVWNGTNFNNLWRAEGIYIIAVEDLDSTTIVDMMGDEEEAPRVSAYYDFYIRTCWYGAGNEQPSTISTVVRLYNPDVHTSLSKHNFDIHYESSDGISWPNQPGSKSYAALSGNLKYVIDGPNPTKEGYKFAGYRICSYDGNGDYATQLEDCKNISDEERISVANSKTYSGSKVTLHSMGEATNVIIYPVFLQMVTVSAQVDDTTKLPSEYGTISLSCTYYECKSGENNVSSATINVPVGDTVTAKANDGGGFRFLNWSGNGETYREGTTWRFKVTGNTAVVAHFTFDITRLPGMRVLNVYPNNGNNLTGWMSSFGRGKITVTSTPISNFNSNFSKFNANDYDAIVFGFWDCNSSIDLSSGAATWVENNFLTPGKAILFGHDTINYGTGTCGAHTNFNRFARYAGFNTNSTYYPSWSSGPYSAGTTVIINVDSAFVSYPWDIGGTGTKLTIPYAHTLQQYVSNRNNIYLKFTSIDSNVGNFYLTVNDQYNVAMIQTGHSNGAATADEQKIIANVLFYMYSVYYKNTH